MPCLMGGEEGDAPERAELAALQGRKAYYYGEAGGQATNHYTTTPITRARDDIMERAELECAARRDETRRRLFMCVLIVDS